MSSLKCGIIGMPNVGKSTLFNALLKKRVALSANYPFATVEPNVGVVAVPDDRLVRLSELVRKEEKMENPPPRVPAVVEFVDIAGLVKGAHQGAGLGNQFLSHIREVDTIIHVLRDFEDENVVREGSISPDEDKLTVEIELGLADLQTLEKLIVTQDKEVRGSKDPIEQKKLEILNKLKSELERGNMVKSSFAKISEGMDERLKDWFPRLPLLSIKPVLYIRNVDEGRVKETYYDTLEYHSDKLAICAKLEEELADLSEEDRLEYLKEMGVEETGLERLIRKVYHLLGLVSFFTTTGKKEVRAWTVKLGTKAPQAAGIIHTDFEKKFIRAQVISYDKLVEVRSYAEAKKKGWIRTEGKDYIIQDGDVVEFLVGS